MKTGIHKTFSLFLFLAMLLSIIQFGSVTSFAATNTDFTVVNGVLTKYNGSASNVSIPDTVNSIGAYAFNECADITKITIPNSVTSIGRYAFEQCTGLTKITIPDSVTSIGNYAFDQCTALKSAVISGDTKSIGLGIFDDCDQVTISGYKNTAVHTYATKYNISFKSLGLGTLTLYAKNCVVAPKNSYAIGVKLIGADLTTRVSFSKNSIVKVEKVSSGQYKITGLKVGITSIIFNVYDKKSKQLAHASVKAEVKRGAASNGNSSKRVITF